MHRLRPAVVEKGYYRGQYPRGGQAAPSSDGTGAAADGARGRGQEGSP